MTGDLVGPNQSLLHRENIVHSNLYPPVSLRRRSGIPIFGPQAESTVPAAHSPLWLGQGEWSTGDLLGPLELLLGGHAVSARP